MTHPPEFNAALDRLDTVGTCIEAVVDLLVPEMDLHAVQRDRFATLLHFLQQEQQAATAAVRQVA